MTALSGRVMTTIAAGAIAVGAVLALPLETASAQAPTGPLPKQDTPLTTQQKNCIPQNGAADPNPETRGQGLGDELSKSNGVICPPVGVDPDITAPPPGGGRTPVLPPPGTPGGNPNLQPK